MGADRAPPGMRSRGSEWEELAMVVRLLSCEQGQVTALSGDQRLRVVSTGRGACPILLALDQ